MSDIIMGTIGPLPDNADEARTHVGHLLEDMNREAARIGWAGADFTLYQKAGSIIRIEAKAGQVPLSLDRMRAFRDEQRRRREEEEGKVA